jgi:hypothetical protein
MPIREHGLLPEAQEPMQTVLLPRAARLPGTASKGGRI